MNPYQVLGVSQTDYEDIIKKAYRKAAKECHPDTHPGDKRAEERCQSSTERTGKCDRQIQCPNRQKERRRIDLSGRYRKGI